jgi:triosephosphate isomerase
MKQKLIAGNWKMNGSLAANEALVHGVQQGLAQALGGKHAQVAVCVPAAYLSQVQQLVKGSGIDLGSQDVSAHEQGAYTGEVAAVMLKDFAVRYAIVGLSLIHI